MTISTLSDWAVTTHRPGDPTPGQAGLHALRAGRAGLFRFQGLATRVALATLRDQIAARRAAATVSRYSNATLTTWGSYLAKHLANPAAYFARARESDVLFPDPLLDLRAHVRRGLCQQFDLRSMRVATEPDGRRYADGIVRLHADGVCNPLHNDHIARDAAGTGLALAGVQAQLSCVVCLQECDTGGELVLYRKMWEPADERFKETGALGYTDGVVDGTDKIVFKPQTGDVYVMNPVNYHAINTVGGAERQTLGFFIGFLTDDPTEAVVWS